MKKTTSCGCWCRLIFPTVAWRPWKWPWIWWPAAKRRSSFFTWSIDGQAVPPDPRRAGGIHANAAMRLDPVLKNTGLVDTVGGIAVFYQSQVKLIRVTA